MNYGKRRLLFLTKEQLDEGWIASKHTPTKQKTRKFTVKEWKKFNLQEQEWLTKLYQVILTDHLTRKEKIMRIVNGFTPENVHKYSNMVSKNIAEFSKAMDGLSFGGGKQNKKFLDYKEEKDFSFITGKDKKKNMEFLNLK